MALSKIKTASIADSTVTSDLLAAGAIPGKNLIINGAMQVAQRSTSSTGQTTTGYKTCDRWLVVLNSAGTYTITQDTSAPDGFTHSLKMDVTTADSSLAASDEVIVGQRIESQNLWSFKKGTSAALEFALSFWVKSSKTGTYTVELDDNDNTKQVSKTYTIDTADTWEHKTLTFPADTASGGAFARDSGIGLQVLFWLAAGSNLTSGTLNDSAWASVTAANRVSSSNVNLSDSTSNDWYLTGVQLEIKGHSSFEHMSYSEQLALCQRYYNNKSWGNQARQNAGSELGTNVVWPVTMRTTPSCSITNLSGQNSGSPSLTRPNQSKVDWYKSRDGNEFINFRVIADAEL